MEPIPKRTHLDSNDMPTESPALFDWAVEVPDLVDPKSLPRMIGELAIAVGQFAKVATPAAYRAIKAAHRNYREHGHTSGKPVES